MYKKNLSNKIIVRLLRESEACEEAREWVAEHGGNSSELWRDCARGDWMAWIVARRLDFFGITKRQLVGALADCAALSLKFYEAKYPDDKRVRNCIRVCRAYARGKATEEQLRNAADAAAYAASSAAYAAYAAADAAAAAYVAAAAQATFKSQVCDYIRLVFNPFK